MTGQVNVKCQLLDASVESRKTPSLTENQKSIKKMIISVLQEGDVNGFANIKEYRTH